jgi:hypothetical protein
MLGKPPGKGKVWYPTLIGESDLVGGETVTLLFAEFPDGASSIRRFKTREMVFPKNPQ